MSAAMEIQERGPFHIVATNPVNKAGKKRHHIYSSYRVAEKRGHGLSKTHAHVTMHSDSGTTYATWKNGKLREDASEVFEVQGFIRTKVPATMASHGEHVSQQHGNGYHVRNKKTHEVHSSHPTLKKAASTITSKNLHDSHYVSHTDSKKNKHGNRDMYHYHYHAQTSESVSSNVEESKKAWSVVSYPHAETPAHSFLKRKTTGHARESDAVSHARRQAKKNHAVHVLHNGKMKHQWSAGKRIGTSTEKKKSDYHVVVHPHEKDPKGARHPEKTKHKSLADAVKHGVHLAKTFREVHVTKNGQSHTSWHTGTPHYHADENTNEIDGLLEGSNSLGKTRSGKKIHPYYGPPGSKYHISGHMAKHTGYTAADHEDAAKAHFQKGSKKVALEHEARASHLNRSPSVERARVHESRRELTSTAKMYSSHTGTPHYHAEESTNESHWATCRKCGKKFIRTPGTESGKCLQCTEKAHMKTETIDITTLQNEINGLLEGKHYTVSSTKFGDEKKNHGSLSVASRHAKKSSSHGNVTVVNSETGKIHSTWKGGVRKMRETSEATAVRTAGMAMEKKKNPENLASLQQAIRQVLGESVDEAYSPYGMSVMGMSKDSSIAREEPKKVFISVPVGGNGDASKIVGKIREFNGCTSPCSSSSYSNLDYVYCSFCDVKDSRKFEAWYNEQKFSVESGNGTKKKLFVVSESTDGFSFVNEGRVADTIRDILKSADVPTTDKDGATRFVLDGIEEQDKENLVETILSEACELSEAACCGDEKLSGPKHKGKKAAKIGDKPTTTIVRAEEAQSAALTATKRKFQQHMHAEKERKKSVLSAWKKTHAMKGKMHVTAESVISEIGDFLSKKDEATAVRTMGMAMQKVGKKKLDPKKLVQVAGFAKSM